MEGRSPASTLSDHQRDGLRLQLGPETIDRLAPEVTYPRIKSLRIGT